MNEDAIELMLFGAGFLIPVMMFVATGFSFAGKAKQQDNSPKQRWRERLLVLGILSSVAVFFSGHKDAAIILALSLLAIQKLGCV